MDFIQVVGICGCFACLLKDTRDHCREDIGRILCHLFVFLYTFLYAIWILSACVDTPVTILACIQHPAHTLARLELPMSITNLLVHAHRMHLAVISASLFCLEPVDAGFTLGAGVGERANTLLGFVFGFRKWIAESRFELCAVVKAVFSPRRW